MKLAQRLAMVIATAMIATAIPMTTMAATSTTVNTVDMIYGDTFSYTNDNYNPVELSMKNTQNNITVDASYGLSFYITGDDVRFSSELYRNIVDSDGALTYTPTNSGRYFTILNGTYTEYISESDLSGLGITPKGSPETIEGEEFYINYTIKRDSNTQLTVTLWQDFPADNFIVLPLAFDVTGYGPTVSIQGNQGITSATELSLSSSTGVSENSTSASLGYEGYISVDGYGTLGTVRFQESKAGAFAPNNQVNNSYEEVNYNVSAAARTTDSYWRDDWYNSSDNEVEVIHYGNGEYSYSVGGVELQEYNGAELSSDNLPSFDANSGDYDRLYKRTSNNYLIQLKNNKLEWELDAGDFLYIGTKASNEFYDGAEVLNPPSSAANSSRYVGLSGGLATSTVADYFVVQVVAVDDDEMVINVVDLSPTSASRSLRGYVEVGALPVRLASRSDYLSLGELEVEVTEVAVKATGLPTGLATYDVSDFTSTKTISERLTIANIINDQIVFQAYNEVELITGQEPEAVELSLHQIIEGAINPRDPFYFTLKSGGSTAYFYTGDGDDDALNDIIFEFDGNRVTNNTDGNKIITQTSGSAGHRTELQFDIQALINAFGLTDEDEIHQMLDNLYFELQVGAYAEKAGDVTLYIESRNFDDDKELYLGTAIEPITIDWEQVQVELGVKEQTRGTIVISESDSEMLKRNGVLTITPEDLGAIKITGATISADDDSGLEISTKVNSDSSGIIQITIDDESSNGPGTITISDIKYDIWGNTPRGGYDFEIEGTAIDAKGKTITLDDYIVVGSDIFSQQIKVEVNFTTNTAYDALNSEDLELFAAPYLSDSGRTMIGVRDLATFFNIHEDNIIFTSGGHVTIKNGNSLITLTNGSNIIYKDGQPIYMDEPMQIVNDRSYAPVKYIALALGVNADYDADTKVATFYN
ncbi:MAG: hypothetical protein BEN18_04750 [Epulopiscium sp. Nuni2H_MBin001]|nr:MAG: hypothetical protein BEN18_04750 [Epulopiscium sp. Nuni2H_MBin001]